MPPADAAEVDAHRKATYLSYERFLRERLTALDVTRAARWKRSYSSPDAYARSVAPMRARLKEMLAFWLEPGDRPAPKCGDEETLLTQDEFIARRYRLEILPGVAGTGMKD